MVTADKRGGRAAETQSARAAWATTDSRLEVENDEGGKKEKEKKIRKESEAGEESREGGENSAIKDQHKHPYKKETWAGEK